MQKRTEEERVKRDKALLQQLVDERIEKVEDRWDFAIKYVVPFLNEWGDEVWEDSRYDTTATESSGMLADGQFGNTMSPNSDWLKYTTDNEKLNTDEEFAQYLADRTDKMYAELRRSNFYDLMPECLQVGNSVETANVYIEEEEGEGRVSLSARHPWEIYVTQDKYGKINRIMRKFQLTAEQAADKFDTKNMSQGLKDAIEDREGDASQDKYWFIHVIERRKNHNPEKPGAKNMPIASRYFEYDGEDKYLHEGGYKTWPMPIWRWKSRSSSAYGYGPTSELRPKIEVANQIQKDLLRANHKAIDPPYQTHRSMRGKVNLNPGGGTYLKDVNQDRVLEMPPPSGLAAGQVELEMIQEQIKMGYKADHFLMLLNDDDTQKTAREIYERKAEKTTVVGSTVGKFISEFLIPCLERIDQLAYDNGRIPEVPQKFVEEYGGTEIKFEFLGPLAQAQKQLVETQGIVQALEVGAMVVEMVPTSIDNLDADETYRSLMTSYGVAERLRSEDKVAEIRQQRAAVEQQQIEFAQKMEMIKNMPALTKGAEQNSPMQKMAQEKQGAR